MFCVHCGNELPEGTKFCIHCGASQAAAPAAPAAPVEEPVYQNSLASEPCVIPTVEAPAAEMPVVEETAPVFETPVAAEEVTEAPKKAKKEKKGKKGGVIIAIVLAVVLLAGAGVGAFFFLDNKNKTEAYEEAEALLEAGDYEGALAAFEELGSFDDAEERVEELNQLQADYNAAMKLLDKHDFEGARKAFKKLGDYRDSEAMVESGVDYHMAQYLMDCGASANPAGLELAEGYPLDDSDEALSLHLYGTAYNILIELGDYENAADLASACMYESAMIYLGWGDYETALELMEQMNEEDAAALYEQYSSNAVDAKMLASLEEALVILLDEDDNYLEGQEARAAYELMAVYEDEMFMDADLEAIYYGIMDALELQLSACDEDGYVDDWVVLYEGEADIFYYCDLLNRDYGFLEGSYLEAEFVGIYEEYQYWPEVEASLTEQFTGVTAYANDAGVYEVGYYNNTGHDFSLYVVPYFYNGSTLVETGEAMTLYIEAGVEVMIPLVPETLSDDEWDGWDFIWVFDLDM